MKVVKKVIQILGIIALAIVVILNVIYTADMNSGEQVTIKFNSFPYILGLLLMVGIIYGIAKFADKKLKKKKVRLIIVAVAVIIYLVFSILWIIFVRPGIVADSIHVLNLAQTYYRDDPNQFLPNLTYAGIPLIQYMQAYPHQVTLAFVYNVMFSILHCDLIILPRIFNIFFNLLIIFGLYKITKQLAKQYKTNNTLMFILIFTFITIPMLTTFMYGDIPALALSLFSLYFMMKYTETKKIRYGIFASLLTMVAYMMRMNTLIFVIATVIYLVLNIFKDFKQKAVKEKLINLAVIAIFLALTFIPSSLVKIYYLNKYDLKDGKTYPSISYFLMAMEEGPRANGWYSESIAEPALNSLKTGENISDEYKEKIKQRLEYFAKNPGYTIDFYQKKLTTTWAESTYSALFNNGITEESNLNWIKAPLTFYQKALIILTFTCAIIVLVQNRKNLSLELIFLVTIFLGGFCFHILWEAKSRYIIPYIVVLIPVASVMISVEGIRKLFGSIKEEFIMKEIILNIEGMHCTGCSNRLTKVLNNIDGVEGAEVSFETKKATIKYDESKVSVETIKAEIEEAGFKAE